MPGDATIGSVVTGVCNHGASCCPHLISGTVISGSGTVLTEGPGQATIGSSITTTCPHCHTGICISGSATVLTEGPGNHRIGDGVTLPGGSGVTTTGSGTCISE